MVKKPLVIRERVASVMGQASGNSREGQVEDSIWDAWSRSRH